MPTSFEVLSDEAFEALRTNGIKVNYWVVCQRKVWLYAKGLRMEPLSDRVALGRLLHERAYPDLPRRELLIDDLIKVDLLEHESKVGELRFPKERRKEEVRLTPELEAQVVEALRDIQRIEQLPSSPGVDFMPICRVCAYCELCWGESGNL